MGDGWVLNGRAEREVEVEQLELLAHRSSWPALQLDAHIAGIGIHLARQRVQPLGIVHLLQESRMTRIQLVRGKDLLTVTAR